MDDVVLNKSEMIENCLKRIEDIYDGDPAHLIKDQTKQDAIILNLERLCQAAIDLAIRLVKKKKLGLPKDSAESFLFLEKAQILTTEQSARLRKMVGFRNIAVHDYQELNLKIVQSIIEKELGIFKDFVSVAISTMK